MPSRVKKSGTQSSQRTEAIVVLGGSFAPLHAGHLAALEAGRRTAEQEGFRVVAGYLVVAPQHHLCGKLCGRGDDVTEAIPEAIRLGMCNEVAEASDWLRPTPCPYFSARKCGEAMVDAHHRPSTKVLVAKGSQLPTLSKGRQGQTLSSTYVRDAVKAGGVASVRRLADEGVLPPAVARRLEQWMAGSPTQLAEVEHEAVTGLVRGMSTQMKLHLKEGGSEDALAAANSVLATEPTNARAHACRGCALARLGRAAEAAAELELALSVTEDRLDSVQRGRVEKMLPAVRRKMMASEGGPPKAVGSSEPECVFFSSSRSIPTADAEDPCRCEGT